MENSDTVVAQATDPVEAPPVVPVASLTIKIKYGKEEFEITIPSAGTVLNLKQAIEKKTSLLPALQKLMTPKGQLKPEKDGATLAAAGLVDGTKILLVGSQIMDVLALAAPPLPSAKAEKAHVDAVQSLSEQTSHAKVVAGGPPEDSEPGDPSGAQNPIPTGVNREPTLVAVNNKKEKLRVVFRGGGAVVNTKASSFPINAGSVRDVQSEPISGHPGYHIVTILLRDSANSKYFLYWVPAQYVQNLRNLLLGW